MTSPVKEKVDFDEVSIEFAPSDHSNDGESVA